jgi:hypothetical protein
MAIKTKEKRGTFFSLDFFLKPKRMATSQPSFNTNPEQNYYSFLARKPFEGKRPDASEVISGSSHIVEIDSTQRDLILFPNPAYYAIKFDESFKNVTSIELKGSIIPKTEYNVHTQNMFIPFNVQDYLTGFRIVNPGYGYVDGTYGFGAVPPNDTFATVSPPAITGGTNALITVTVVGNQINSVVIADPGTGYLRGSYGQLEYPAEGFYINSGATFVDTIPFEQSLLSVARRAIVRLNVGNELVAQLREGQYDFDHPNDSAVGLCREVTRSLQEAVDNAIADGLLTPVVGGPQTGAEYFPYSATDSNDGSCFLYTPNPNASENPNVAIQRGEDDGTYMQDLFLELLFGQPNYGDSSAVNLLGFGTSTPSTKLVVDQTVSNFRPLDQTTGTTSALVGAWTSTPIEGRNNYDLVDTPKYVILTIGPSNNTTVDRIDSPNETLNKAFATLVFDANTPEVVFRAPSGTATPGEGNSDYSSLLFKPGFLKAIKGADFDSKIIHFGPSPISEVSGIQVSFRKINGDLYNFHGHDNKLTFEIGANDINSGNRW